MVDIYSRLVVGVKLEKVYRKENVTKTVTRYNEITGQPYQKNIETIVHYLGNKTYVMGEFKPYESFEAFMRYNDSFEEFTFNDNNMLKKYTINFFSADGHVDEILGVQVVSTSSHRSGNVHWAVEVSLEMVGALLAKTREVFNQKFGINPEDVSLFLMPYHSY